MEDNSNKSEQSKGGYLYNPHYDKKGIELVEAMNDFCICLNELHNNLYLYNGKNAFIYEDLRLKQCNEKFNRCCNKISTQDTYKAYLWQHELYKLKDVILFWLKEDILIRSVVFKEFNIDLTDEEKEHVKKWDL